MKTRMKNKRVRGNGGKLDKDRSDPSKFRKAREEVDFSKPVSTKSFKMKINGKVVLTLVISLVVVSMFAQSAKQSKRLNCLLYASASVCTIHAIVCLFTIGKKLIKK